jgi:Tfp pilus assembly protein PilO
MRAIPRIYSFFLPMLAMNEWVRWMVVLLLLILFVGVWRFAMHTTVGRWIDGEYAAIKQLKKQLRHTDGAESESVLLRTKIDALEQQLAIHQASDYETAWWGHTHYVLDLLQKTGLFVQGYSALHTEPVIKNALVKKSIKIDFSGNAKQVQDFFTQLSQSKRMVQLKQVTLNKAENGFAVSADIALVSVDTIKNKKSLQPQIS